MLSLSFYALSTIAKRNSQPSTQLYPTCNAIRPKTDPERKKWYMDKLSARKHLHGALSTPDDTTMITLLQLRTLRGLPTLRGGLSPKPHLLVLLRLLLPSFLERTFSCIFQCIRQAFMQCSDALQADHCFSSILACIHPLILNSHKSVTRKGNESKVRKSTYQSPRSSSSPSPCRLSSSHSSTHQIQRYSPTRSKHRP